MQFHRSPLANRAARLWRSSLDWVFPPMCAHCGRVDTRWCAACTIKLLAEPLALYRHQVPPLIASAATGAHEGILRDAVHALKFNDATELAASLGERLAQAALARGWTRCTLVPVPLHPNRLRTRGYNQSAVIAQAAADRLSLPCLPDALQRVRADTPQVGSDRAARLANVENAFEADRAQVDGRWILLIDDVQTTGATLMACAEAALTAGARGITALTITYA